MRTILQQLVFLNSLSEDEADLDITCKAIEDIQATLMDLSLDERQELAHFAENEMMSSYHDTPQAITVLRLLRSNLGLEDEQEAA